MADERDRWLDRAAADRLLRGEPVEPVGPAASPRARAEAARLRAALDILAEPPPGGGELPGEAAALAAFRAARAARVPQGPPAAGREASGSGVPVLDLGRLTPVAAPRPRRHVRFGLAAALAGVAVGGLAAAAGAGLLDQNRHDSAGPGPATSVSAEGDRTPEADGAPPTAVPPLLPTPLRGGTAPAPGTGGAAPEPGGDGRTEPGGETGGGTGGASSDTAGAGGADEDARADQGDPGGSAEGDVGGKDAAGGSDGNRDTFANGGSKELDLERDRENRQWAASLCADYRAGRLDKDRREKLSNLARGLTRIERYCGAVLDGGAMGGMRGGAPGAPGSAGDGDGVFRAPTLTPALPGGSGGHDRR
ncbi:hypothetical protein [Streptomyces sp. NPDC058674]|uniref:hypothetical protein n=1 Tax=Streptomyces sp. NPDC058674 TaxID=3346592 RepID=UPI00366A4936